MGHWHEESGRGIGARIMGRRMFGSGVGPWNVEVRPSPAVTHVSYRLPR